MLEPGDTARRDELRRLAYGRDGGLTDTQARELRDLDARLRADFAERVTPADPAAVDSGDGEPAPATEPATPSAPATTATDGAGSGGATAPTAPIAEERPRGIRRFIVPGIAAVVALVLGGGIGWLLAARAAQAAPAMTAAQSETWADLEAEGDYDPGSVRLVGSKYDASLWAATQDDAAFQCVIITHPKAQAEQCLSPDIDIVGGGLATQIDFAEGDMHTFLWASLATDITGHEVGIIERQQSTEDGPVYDWRHSYTSDELVEAEQLVEDGHPGDLLTIIGYDQDRPVWLTQDAQSCLAVFIDGEVQQNCLGEYPDSGAVLDLMIDDETVYQVRMTDNRGPVLTIVRIPEPVVCAEGAPDDSTTQTCALTFDKEKWD